jgi:peptidylprolyl isomerase
MKTKNISFSILTALIIIATVACGAKSTDEKTSNTDQQGMEVITPAPEKVEAKKEEGLFAEINTTKGTILVKFEFIKTPLTVANFVGLAEGTIENTFKAKGAPFYDGIIFHRVIPNFMIQGGDPTGSGMGDPGYKFRDEIDATLKHDKPGILSMANSGPGGTNGSQFFITHNETPWLDGRHTVFGHVVEGQNVVNAIQQGDAIETIKIIRVGKEAKAFDAAKVFAEMK